MHTFINTLRSPLRPPFLTGCKALSPPRPSSRAAPLRCPGLAAGFNAPISGVFFAVETVLRRQPERVAGEDAAEASGLTVAMVLLASVLASVVSQVRERGAQGCLSAACHREGQGGEGRAVCAMS